MTQQGGIQNTIEDFGENTFIAFIDISGFKELMKKDNEAWSALTILYNQGYNIIKDHNNINVIQIVGLFISDSVILFPRIYEDQQIIQGFISLLNIIKELNDLMLERNWMLVNTVAYGDVEYYSRIEFRNIRKEPVYGAGYVKAVMAHEEPNKILPGQCRIVKSDLPRSIVNRIGRGSDIFKMIKKSDYDDKNYYYYWMRDSPHEIEDFKQSYNDARNKMYDGYASALKGDRILRSRLNQ